MFLPLVAGAVEWTYAISQDRKQDRRWGWGDKNLVDYWESRYDKSSRGKVKNSHTYSLSVKRRPR